MNTIYPRLSVFLFLVHPRQEISPLSPAGTRLITPLKYVELTPFLTSFAFPLICRKDNPFPSWRASRRAKGAGSLGPRKGKPRISSFV